ncbi:hypothetical protein [Streptomyces sp. NPDC050504]|uniref:hypothetical protein n=1 Tax=Streptomyces sp. NPDC050504 TaxID=3365618 RepID=UPI00378E8AA3
MHSDTLLWRPPGRMWEVHTAPSSSSVHDSVEVHCALTGCEIETPIPCGTPKEWAGAHLLAHARAAGAPSAGAFCRCRAQSCRHHELSLLCHGPVQLALLSTPDGWEAIEACSACVAANEGAEAIASSRPRTGRAGPTGPVRDPAAESGNAGSADTAPRILTRRQGVFARRVFFQLADIFPDVSPDARLFALFLVLRMARTGVTAFCAGDLNALRLENPRSALTECLSSGWAAFSVAEMLTAPPADPAVVRVSRPAELRGEFPLEEKDRARISGWATKGKSFRGLRPENASVRLAALCLAAHAEPGGGFRIGEREMARACAVEVRELPAVCEGLLASGWAAELRTRGERWEGRLGRYALYFVPGDRRTG